MMVGETIVPGRGRGELLSANVGLSFWGGVDAVSGTVIDRNHPLCGESVAGKVLAIPNGRGSCTGSQVVLELLLAGQAPAAVLLRRPDQIIALGVIVAEELFGRSMPVVSVGEAGFARLVGRSGATASVDGARVLLQGDDAPPPSPSLLPLSLLGAATEAAAANAAAGAAESGAAEAAAEATTEAHCGLTLSAADQAMLDGAHGRAAQVAMKIIARVAALQRATELVDVTQAHIDGCIYVGPASLRFAQQMLAFGGAVRVPTTLNAISVDQRRWRELGVAASHGEPASALGDVYVALGCTPSFTCAPYLASRPSHETRRAVTQGGRQPTSTVP